MIQELIGYERCSAYAAPCGSFVRPIVFGTGSHRFTKARSPCAGTEGDIEARIVPPIPTQTDGHLHNVLPHQMEATGLQIAHQIMFRGDFVEAFIYDRLFVVDADGRGDTHSSAG